MRDVVTQPFAVFTAVAWGKPVTRFIGELARQWRSGCLALCSLALGCRCLQDVQHFLPRLRINDRRVLSVKDLIFVANASSIDWDGQNVMDVTTIKGLAA